MALNSYKKNQLWKCAPGEEAANPQLIFCV